MHVAKLTSKGQVTIPRSVRDALALEPGDRIAFRLMDGSAEITKQSSLADLHATVPVPDDVRGLDWDEIKAVTARRRAERWEDKVRRLAD